MKRIDPILLKQALKQRVFDAIENEKQLIFDLGEKLWLHPELGYKENYATQNVAEALSKLDLAVEMSIAVTGCHAKLKGKQAKPRIAILGELDSVICSEHACANQETGAVHACGHHIQTAAMYGVALGLVRSGVIHELDGTVDFFAVPAEECIEFAYRAQLKAEGKINYFGGKQELISRGYFDDIDMAIMFHSLDCGEHAAQFGSCGNGYISKMVTFIGKEAHAGANPEEGINALNAATLAINNIHANRETFRDQDRVRIHPILTQAGEIVNTVPALVKMESMVRAKTISSIIQSSQVFNRAVRAGAMAVGAKVTIEEIMGYLPLHYHHTLSDCFVNNMAELVGQEHIVRGEDHAGSSDIGDLSQIMPTIHPSIGGIRGALHTRSFELTDPDLAYITSAKVLAAMVIDLLFDNAHYAHKVLKQDIPPLTKAEYLSIQEKYTSKTSYNYTDLE